MARKRIKKAWEKGGKARKPRGIRQILILCEDEKSSRDYFAQFPVDPNQVEIDCIGTGMNTDSLMENAIERKEKGNYEQIWVVFDKDSFSDHQFNRAFDLAKGHNNIVACWSNECFELWYLLHFHFWNTGIGRKDLVKKLKTLLKGGYDKSDTSMYSKLYDKMDQAIENGERLAFKNGEAGTIHDNPSTHVQRLVKLLKSFDPGEQ